MNKINIKEYLFDLNENVYFIEWFVRVFFVVI